MNDAPEPLPPASPTEHRPAATLAQAFALGRLHVLLLLSRLEGAISNEQVHAAYSDYIRSAARNEAELRLLEQLGLPDVVDPPADTTPPFASWTLPDAVANDTWGQPPIKPLDAPDEPAIVPSQPFLPRDLGSFPEGTVSYPILDPRHAAIACLAELLRCQAQDLQRLTASTTDAQRYRALVVLRAWYTAVADAAFMRLPQDQLLDWTREIPLPLRYELIPVVVHRRAATAMAQRVLTVRLATHCFALEFERAISLATRNPDQTVETLLADRLERLASNNASLLRAFNLNLVSDAKSAVPGSQLMVVHRSLQEDRPLLLSVPEQAVASVTSLDTKR